RFYSYLHGTSTLGITYNKGLRMELYAFADSSFAGDFFDRRSVSGGAIIFGGTVLSCFTRTQRTVALSTSELSTWPWESVSKSCCVYEMDHISCNSRICCPKCVYVLEDRKGAINLAPNLLRSGKTEYIELRLHFFVAWWQGEKLEFFHVCSL
ncbi:unnamed protein product, partial [Discosporangium mesarthrocarpum]